MTRRAKPNTLFDAIPDPVWWLVGAVSGFIAGHVFSEENVVRLATPSGRTVAVIAALGLGLTFAFMRRKFPGFANVCLWCATFSIGVIRW